MLPQISRFALFLITAVPLAACTGTVDVAGDINNGDGDGDGDGGDGDGDGDGDATPLMGAPGVNIDEISLYQGLKHSLLGGTDSVPVVVGRDAMIRVFASTDGAYDGQPVLARVTIEGSPPVDLEVPQVSGPGTEASLNSTININVPGELITDTSAIRVELLQDGTPSSGNAAATFPQGEGVYEDLGAQSSGTALKIVLVPVQYNGRLPITTPQQVDLYKTGFKDVYPTHDVEITLRAQGITHNGTLDSGGNGWSALLNTIADLRQADNAPADTFYYGVFRPTDNAGQFCGQGCVAGLGYVPGANDDFGRASIGLGFSGDFSVGIAVHELGHNVGRPHAPCGNVAGADPQFPHAGGRIGTWGYSLASKELKDPAVYADFMGYCSDNWISDYTYNLAFNRLRAISTQRIATGPKTTWNRVSVEGGLTTPMSSIDMTRPGGVATSIQARSASGQVELEGHFLPYDHIDGGVLFYPATSDRLTSVQFGDYSVTLE